MQGFTKQVRSKVRKRLESESEDNKFKKRSMRRRKSIKMRGIYV